MKKQAFVAILILFLTTPVTHAETSDYSNAAIGKPDDGMNVSRTINIEVFEYRFAPSEINVKQGEAIRLIVSNTGNMGHEIMLGTLSYLKEHAKMRYSHPVMQFNDPNHVTLHPGEQKTLIWQFTQAGVVHFACPIPGHFVGMRGKIFVEEI